MSHLGAPDLIDTHAHLDDPVFAGTVAEVIERAAAAGVHRIVNIGYRPAGWEPTLALAAAYPGVAYTLGIHPNHATEATDEHLAQLASLIAATNPVAIGEIGIDLYRDYAPFDVQERAFAAQIEIAAAAGLPVVIHQRDAEDALLSAMAEAPPTVTFILHSFDGSEKLLEAAIERRCPIGVGGLMTRPGSDRLRSLLERVPDELLLLETDAPYLKPAALRGSRNVPANLVVIAQRLAALRSTTIDAIARTTTDNAERVFRLNVAVARPHGDVV